MAEILDLGSGQPFKQNAMKYWEAGWIPLLLPPGQKSPPPRNTTGHWPPPGIGVIDDWMLHCEERSNIGLRMPDGILGIDVDNYSGKVGGRELAALIAQCGPLPPTWTLTARADGVSGIRFFRVPPGRAWPGEIGKDIQLIQHRHRYTVTWPSLHPKLRKMYHWYPPGAKLNGQSFVNKIPNVSELPAWGEV